MYIAFYKDTGIGAKLIQWWTGSEFNHCELWNGNELIGVPSNARKIRKQKQDYLNNKKWTIYKVIDKDFINSVNEFFEITKSKEYDNKAIWLSNIFNRKKHDKNKYTCSEWLMECLDYHYNVFYPKWYHIFSPQDVLEIVKELKIVKE